MHHSDVGLLAIDAHLTTFSTVFLWHWKSNSAALGKNAAHRPKITADFSASSDRASAILLKAAH
jgi:hypothetical protein